MKTTLVLYYDPREVLGISLHDANKEELQEIKDYCFKFRKYPDESQALWAYAETPAGWSALLDDEKVDILEWADEAFEHIKAHDHDWLEQNFT